jgi:drug/metabolite transporter (DMT)-like permease
MVLNASGSYQGSVVGNTSGFLGNRSVSPESVKLIEPGITLKDDLQMAVAIFCVPSILYLLATDMLRQPSLVVICFVSAVYMVASLAMNVLNKRAAKEFEGTCLLVIIQMLVSVVVIVCMERDKLKMDKWADFVRWLVVPFAFAGMLGTSIFAFKEASLTTILIIRNILPILSFGFEKAVFNQPESMCWKVVMSLAVTLIGSVLYGFADISATNLGKVLILVNCLFTIVDRLVQAHLLRGNRDFSMSISMCMLINNSLGIVPMLVLSALKGETANWGHALTSADKNTWFLVVMSGLCGASLSYVGLRTQQLVSGTTVLVVQNCNKLLIISIGMGQFHENITPLSLLGCAVSLLGCFAYGYLRVPAEAKSDGRVKKEPSNNELAVDAKAVKS